jgi:hypothetical protein
VGHYWFRVSLPAIWTVARNQENHCDRSGTEDHLP